MVKKSLLSAIVFLSVILGFNANAKEKNEIPVYIQSSTSGPVSSFENRVVGVINNHSSFSVLSERVYDRPILVITTSGLHAGQAGITALSVTFSVWIPGDEFTRFINTETFLCSPNQYGRCARNVEGSLSHAKGIFGH
ncbi:hypothetical protein ACNSTU_14545 [Aquisalimonas sp. APHAB1-3]|uniref:hypothetical protein n=1 Tax=Aquisalimonas sp. APHAB1-3 TaxID=3402080 RepID=UPI003AAD5B5D